MSTTRKLTIVISSLAICCGLAACSGNASESTAIPVEIREIDGGYRLYRGGVPYIVKGAGLEFGDMGSFAAHGGNSIRTWTVDNGVMTGQQILDQALELGVTVSLCLPIEAERHGFDYDDDDVVARQKETLREYVLKHRDHPALLTWILGNELNFDYENPAVYDAVNDISTMVHELDPNHPTTTTVAGLDIELLTLIEQRAPDLDFVSFQLYGELAILPKFIADTGYTAAYFVTEWGAIGHWEMPKTTWGAPIEQTSTQKAANYLNSFQNVIAPFPRQAIANYAFLWGQKQERTPTWFGLFTETGEETETIDVMHFVWNDQWPENRTPKLNSLLLDNRSSMQSVRLRPDEEYAAVVDVTDPDGDRLTYLWQLKYESSAGEVGGDHEKSIDDIPGLIDNPVAQNIRLSTPSKAGAYRLFVYAFDGMGHAAHANIPFFVE